MSDQQQTTDPANDNPERSKAAISFTDLAAGLGVDEDFLLRRLARILASREDQHGTE